MPRVAVVGAGFAGLVFSYKLAMAGIDVDIFEEHAKVGYPEHCTGLVSKRVVDLLGSPGYRNVVKAYSRIVISEGSLGVEVEPEGGVFRLDRVRLEEDLLGESTRLGARLFLGSRVKRVEAYGEVVTSDSSMRYDAVIVSEGLRGRLRHRLGLGIRGGGIYGLNAEYSRGPPIGPDEILVEFNGAVSTDFFSWILDSGSGAILAGSASRTPLLKDLLARLERRWGLEGRRRVYGGSVLTGPVAERLSLGRVHVVGDAAGMVKPLTGGGLYPNTRAAHDASRLYARGVDINNALKTALSGVASELRRQYRLARIILEDQARTSSLIRAVSEASGGRIKVPLDYDDHASSLPRIALGSPMLAVRAAVEAARMLGVKKSLELAIRLISAIL